MLTKNQPEDFQDYLTDASNMQGGYASKLFKPESAEEVCNIVREANDSGISVTVSGARTGTVGGAVPFGGYIVSMERLNRIRSVDHDKRTVVAEPGVILRDLQKAVDGEGLFYPPDPTEWSCQIGGTVATNASGSRSFKYGDTRRYVQGLKVVLAEGDVLTITRGAAVSQKGEPLSLATSSGRTITVKVPTYKRPRVRKNVCGYFNARPLDAIDLFIGSEGTLGIITEVELLLLPKPEGFFGGIVFFPHEADLLAFVDNVKKTSFSHRSRADATVRDHRLNDRSQNNIDASLLEYFDDQALRFIAERFPEVPSGMAGAIFFEQETTAENEDRIFEAWNELLDKHHADVDQSWFATNDQDREKMREFRHALPVSVNEFIARHDQRKVGTDMAVPDDKFPGFLKFYNDILNSSGIDYVIFGHIGDCHLHANLLPGNEEEAERARHIYGRCIAQAVMLGGCVSAEHGIGKLKAKYLNVMMGERYLNEMADVKRAFDPNGILGRGNMLTL
jgi:D-lactate dehydrogenase (cytochrome)